MSSDDAQQSRNIEAVSDGVDAFRAGDVDAVLAVLHEDVEVHMPSDLPNAGTYRGHDEYRQWLGRWLEAWDAFDIEIDDIEPIGRTHVVASAHQTARGRGSGIPVEMWITYMWDVRDGRAIAMHLYPTRDEAVRVARQREHRGAD
jgi:uncharacterized protein